MSLFESRASKKKKQHKKNLYQQMLYELVRLRREEVIRVDELEKQQKPARVEEAKSEDELLWSMKVNTVRDRLTNKKRMSKERWNRFAGTGDEGGRGL